MGTSDFIATVPFGPGAEAEQKTWEAVRAAFDDRDVLGFWRFPTFAKVGGRFKEPDILLADRELGLIVIEVKAFDIHAILGIHGDDWDVPHFTPRPAPHRQARQQLNSLLHYARMEPMLESDVTGRALVALPHVTRAQWGERGYDRLPTSPPILFKEDLVPSRVLNVIKEAAPMAHGRLLTDAQWKVLLSVLGGRPAHRRPERVAVSSGRSRASVVAELQTRLYDFDGQQARIGYTVVPGPQRIRGIAGSGKTVLLCQRAAQMHLRHPDWDIAYVFFTRSLYDYVEESLDRWLRFFSNGEVGYAQARHKLRALHAWGAQGRPGLYRELCRHAGVPFMTAKDTNQKAPNRGLAEASLALLKSQRLKPCFDAILIDEGQDLVVEDDLKQGDRQAIYGMAYDALRPVSADKPDDRRLIWAYDEAQSLSSLKIPTASELFGPERAKLFQGRHEGGGFKSEVMRRCYRTPGPILTAAHALGMGLLRPDGMLSGLTTQDGWRDIGYEVEGQFLSGHQVTLRRPPEHSPNPMPELWPQPLFAFDSHPSRADELATLVENLRANLGPDGLKPSRELLVVVLGEGEEANTLQRQTAMALMAADIPVFIPTALGPNQLNPRYPNNDPDKFWHAGAVTVSLIHRAKGNEAEMVHVVGLDRVARREDDIQMRNQLFVALSRARGWVSLSGVGESELNDEVRRVLESDGTYRFTFRRPPRRDMVDV